jgi:hypothetical protein
VDPRSIAQQRDVRDRVELQVRAILFDFDGVLTTDKTGSLTTL